MKIVINNKKYIKKRLSSEKLLGEFQGVLLSNPLTFSRYSLLVKPKVGIIATDKHIAIYCKNSAVALTILILCAAIINFILLSYLVTQSNNTIDKTDYEILQSIKQTYERAGIDFNIYEAAQQIEKQRRERNALYGIIAEIADKLNIAPERFYIVILLIVLNTSLFVLIWAGLNHKNLRIFEYGNVKESKHAGGMEMTLEKDGVPVGELGAYPNGVLKIDGTEMGSTIIKIDSSEFLRFKKVFTEKSAT